MTEAKSKLRSKTIMFMVVMGIIDSIVISIGTMQSIMTPEVFSFALMTLTAIQTGGGIYLRTVTTGPVK